MLCGTRELSIDLLSAAKKGIGPKRERSIKYDHSVGISCAWVYYQNMRRNMVDRYNQQFSTVDHFTKYTYNNASLINCILRISLEYNDLSVVITRGDLFRRHDVS